jgi:hypothetical protein
MMDEASERETKAAVAAAKRAEKLAAAAGEKAEKVEKAARKKAKAERAAAAERAEAAAKAEKAARKKAAAKEEKVSAKAGKEPSAKGDKKAKKASGTAAASSIGGAVASELDWGTFNVVNTNGKPCAVVVVIQLSSTKFEEHWYLSNSTDVVFDPWARPGLSHPSVAVKFQFLSSAVAVPPTTTALPAVFDHWKHTTNKV